MDFKFQSFRLFQVFSLSPRAIRWTSLQVVRNYHTITFKEDTFPTIFGLEKEVQRHTGYECPVGIWTQDFQNGLLWSITGFGSPSSTYVGPSWSWATPTCGGILHPAALSPDFDNEKDVFARITKILRIELVYAGEDEFGRITSGKLHLKAPCISAGSFDNYEIRQPLADEELPLRNTGWPIKYKVQPNSICCWF